MNIINIGGWYVGNSAILDWMDGFDELAFVKGDFNVVRLENGVMDILAEPNPFKKIEMINVQKKACYRGGCSVSRTFIRRYTKDLFKPKFSPSYGDHLKFYKDFYSQLSVYKTKLISHEDFDEIAFWNSWLTKLPFLEPAKKDFQHIIYSNPFFYDEMFAGHKNIWPKLFAPYKLIFVHRDPLDQFADIVKAKHHTLSSWPRFHGGTEAMHPADRFLAISKKIYKARLRMVENYTKDELVIFSFEDFLQEHERVTKSLKYFLEINTQRDSANQKFILESSLKNIGKGRFNEEVASLLKGKDYVMEELNCLRDRLITHNNAI